MFTLSSTNCKFLTENSWNKLILLSTGLGANLGLSFVFQFYGNFEDFPIIFKKCIHELIIWMNLLFAWLTK